MGRRSWSSNGLAGCRGWPRQRSGLSVRALQDEKSSSESVPEVGEPVARPAMDKKAEKRAEIDRKRTTALVTGAISVFLGVGYLVLVQLLDSRGVVLVPPPPEAFDP